MRPRSFSWLETPEDRALRPDATNSQAYGPCYGCGEVTAPVNHLCFDCECPTKHERELRSRALRRDAELALENLRDRLAMAALPTARIELPEGFLSAEDFAQLVADDAYSIADAMLLARSKGRDSDPAA